MVRHKKPEYTNTGMTYNTGPLYNQFIESSLQNGNAYNEFNFKNNKNETKKNIEQDRGSFKFTLGLKYQMDFGNLKEKYFKESEDDNYELQNISCCSGDSYQQNEGDMYVKISENEIDEISNINIESEDEDDIYKSYINDSIEEEEEIKEEDNSDINSKISSAIFSIKLDESDDEEDEIQENNIQNEILTEIKKTDLTPLNEIPKIHKNYKIELEEDDEFDDLKNALSFLEINDNNKTINSSVDNESHLYTESKGYLKEKNYLGKHNLFDTNFKVINTDNNFSYKKIKNEKTNSILWPYKKEVEPYRHLKDNHFTKWRQR